MKSLITVAVSLSALIGQVSSHYIFEQLTHAGTKYPVYQYIRKNYNYNSPVTDLKSLDTRCNAGGETGNSTATITMTAGDAFTITSDVAVYHDGPFSIYMAKAPAGTAAVNFDGSGQVWFKILDLGPTFSGGTVTWPLSQTYTYNIPKNLPSGDYLLRIQQLGIHNPYPAGIPQFYIECAQVTVIAGTGTPGTPGPLVSIPGWIDGTEPGYTVNIYNPSFTSYVVPGPSVWAGQGGSATGATTALAATTAAAAPTTVATGASSGSTGAAVAKYGQCGGTGYTGSTTCVAGTTCTVLSSSYSQCT